jgi:hypothetical protein
MKNIFVKIVFTFLMFNSGNCLAQSSGGGADAGGGSDGRFISIEDARELALASVRIVDSLGKDRKNLNIFYKKNREKLLLEIRNSQVVVKPSAEVFLVINGIKITKRAFTNLTSLSPIVLSDRLGSESITLNELSLIIIHEAGHHLGITQEEDDFLDQLAISIINKSEENSPTIKRQLQKQLLWTSCLPAVNPTGTPHCRLHKVYMSNGYPYFQLTRNPAGTCKSDIIAAGTLNQVLDFVAATENQWQDQNLRNFACASVTMLGDLPGGGNTPYCYTVHNGESYSFFHTLIKTPLVSGTLEEVETFADKIKKSTSLRSLCGQGIREIQAQ